MTLVKFPTLRQIPSDLSEDDEIRMRALGQNPDHETEKSVVTLNVDFIESWEPEDTYTKVFLHSGDFYTVTLDEETFSHIIMKTKNVAIVNIIHEKFTDDDESF